MRTFKIVTAYMSIKVTCYSVHVGDGYTVLKDKEGNIIAVAPSDATIYQVS